MGAVWSTPQQDGPASDRVRSFRLLQSVSRLLAYPGLVLQLVLGLTAAAVFASESASDRWWQVGSSALVMGPLAATICGWIWTVTAHQATQQLSPVRRVWPSALALIGPFIPLIGFVLSALVLTEIERIAVAPRSGGSVGEEWRHTRRSLLVWVWGFADRGLPLMLTMALPLGSYVFSPSGGSSVNPIIPMIALTSAVSALCGMVLVRRIAGRLSPSSPDDLPGLRVTRGRSLPPAARTGLLSSGAPAGDGEVDR